MTRGKLFKSIGINFLLSCSIGITCGAGSASAGPQATREYILEFRSGFDPAAAQAAMQSVRLRVHLPYPGARNPDGYAARISDDQLWEIAANDHVSRIRLSTDPAKTLSPGNCQKSDVLPNSYLVRIAGRREDAGAVLRELAKTYTLKISEMVGDPLLSAGTIPPEQLGAVFVDPRIIGVQARCKAAVIPCGASSRMIAIRIVYTRAFEAAALPNGMAKATALLHNDEDHSIEIVPGSIHSTEVSVRGLSARSLDELRADARVSQLAYVCEPTTKVIGGCGGRDFGNQYLMTLVQATPQERQATLRDFSTRFHAAIDNEINIGGMHLVGIRISPSDLASLLKDERVVSVKPNCPTELF